MFKCFFLAILLLVCSPYAYAQCEHAANEETVILVVGDSLSAAYGIDLTDGWVNLLRQRLNTTDRTYTIVNASIAGDTTSGGLSRLETALAKFKPSLVIIELGGNDGLRGLPLKVVRSNLESMVRKSQALQSQVVLLGMRIPSNYGPRYTEKFHGIYQELAKTFELPLIDFFMVDVAQDPALMQSDGIHPNSNGQAALLETAWPAIQEGLDLACVSKAQLTQIAK